MGMFDYITVPKTYFQDILSRNQRRMLQSQVFQTKDLENCLLDYKIFNNKLYLCGHKKKAKRVPFDGAVRFYNSIQDDSYWVEFKFVFLNGVLTKKSVESFKPYELSHYEPEPEGEKWSIKVQTPQTTKSFWQNIKNFFKL